MTLKEPDGQEAGERTVPAPDALTDLHPQRKEPIGYFPSDHEIAAARRLLERRARDDARSQLFFEAVPESGGKVTSKHPDVLVSQLSLMDSFSTGYVHVSDALLTQLTKISCRDHDQDVSGWALAQAVAMIQGIAPRNETEAMLAVQMVAIHNAALATAARLGEANTREQQQAAVNSLSKLTRTFTAQVEVLKNGRLNGVQQIHVYHHRGEPSPIAAPEGT